MDYIALLLSDLDLGFSKSELEKLIGLPRNNLSGILKGEKKISKKSALKIEKWASSEKPNPLELVFTKPIKVGEETSLNGNEIVYSETTPASFDGEKVNIGVQDEYGQMSLPKPFKKEEKSNMPDPKDKVAYLKWLRAQQ